MNRLAAYDTETNIIRQGCTIPEMALFQYRVHGERAQLAHPDVGIRLFTDWVHDRSTTIVGHNLAFDAWVCCEKDRSLMPQVFRAYEDGRMLCTMIRQQLLDIAAGCNKGRYVSATKFEKSLYDLDTVAFRATGRRLGKEVPVRIPDVCVPAGMFNTREAKFLPSGGWYVWGKKGKRGEEDWNFTPAQEGGAKAVRREQGWYTNIRLSYGYLKKIPMEQWPPEAIAYGLEDADATMDVFLWQEPHAAKYLKDQGRQSMHDAWMKLMSAWGIRTNRNGVEKLRTETLARREAVLGRLVVAGLVRPEGVKGQKAGSRDTHKAMRHMVDVCMAQGLPVVRTDSWEDVAGDKKDLAPKDLPEDLRYQCVSLAEEACNEPDDPLLEAYAEYSTLAKVLGNDIAALEKGIVQPVHSHFKLVETGRISSSKPNLTNIRRLPGIRECFWPRLGKVFMQADLPQGELYTLAQVCLRLFGYSKLAEALLAGKDPHLIMAAMMADIDYEDAVRRREEEERIPLPEGCTQIQKEALRPIDTKRDLSKVGNFGIPGGLGAARLVHFGWDTYKVEITEDKARWIKGMHRQAWPEVTELHNWIKGQLPQSEEKVTSNGCRAGATMVQMFSERIRGGCSFTAASNTMFQGLLADAAKNAGWLITKAMYTDPSSPLWGSHLVNFIHDEFIGETEDNDNAHDAAVEMCDLMAIGVNQFLPDVPMPRKKIKPCLMRWWSKEAKPCYVGGRLVPWEGKKAA